MKAILWDGIKQLKGNISFEKEEMEFSFDDFSLTNLSFHLKYSEISKVELMRIFNISSSAIKIALKDGNQNVIVPDDLDEFLNLLKTKREDLFNPNFSTNNK